MLGFIQRVSHRNAALGNLEALLLMYPRKRQFVRDFPQLKAMFRSHFEAGIAPASSAVVAATAIIEDLCRQLGDDEKRAIVAALDASDPGEVGKLAERRVGGEKDERGDQVFFATRFCGVALFMAGKMTGVGALRQEEYRSFAASIGRALDAAGEVGLAEKFRAPAG